MPDITPTDPFESDGYPTDPRRHRSPAHGQHPGYDRGLVYDRSPTEEIDTERIRREAARAARRDLLLKDLTGKVEALTTEQASINRTLSAHQLASLEVASQLKGIKDLIALKLDHTDKKAELAHIKIADHIKDHQSEQKNRQFAWHGLWPSVLAGSISGIVVAAIALALT